MITGNFWDMSTWTFVLALTSLYLAMLVANALRRRIKFIKRSLLPSPVIAGFLLLLFRTLWMAIFKVPLLENVTLELLTYHGLGLGFVAVSLKSNKKSDNKKVQRAYFDTGLMSVSSYLIQAIVGISITLALSYIIPTVFASSGLILPMGFGQGPGQSFTWGKNYETLHGFTNGGSFGLTIGAMGFVSASIGGVFYLKRLEKQGKIKLDSLGDGSVRELNEATSTEGEIPNSESLDKLSIQIALVFVGYFITFCIMKGLYELFLMSNNEFLLNTVNPLVWGFNFLIGTLIAVLIKSVLNGLYKKKIVTRVYTNNFMLSRLSGVFFDIMVVASISAIDLSAFKRPEFIIPLILIGIAGTVVTYVQINHASNKLFPEYSAEQFLAMYGMSTGTASTAMVLLREIDPELTTPASNNIVFQALYAIIFGFPMLLLLGFAPRTDLGLNGWAFLTLGLCIVLYIIMQTLVYRSFIFKKKSKQVEDK